MVDWNWSFLMAKRELRKTGLKLVLFVSAIVIGIAALVAVTSFGDNLSKDIDNQAKELLGADLSLEKRQPVDFPEIESQATEKAYEVNFASMVYFPKVGESRLTQVRALEGNFPFYGELETLPESGEAEFRKGRKRALVEKTLMAQFGAQVGDSIKVGNVTLEIVGSLQRVPGQNGITATVAPAVYIPMDQLEASGLVQYGSRIEYVHYFKFPEELEIEALVSEYEEQWDEDKVDHETVQSQKNSTGRSFQNLTNFLSLVAFIAVLLGCVGVGSAINVFVKEKLPSVAVLRCLGVRSKEIVLVYLVQITIMGLLGSLLGAALGAFLQFLLPFVFSDFLPVEVSVQISWKAVIMGTLTGVLISILFALMPLLKIRKVSPMMTLRPDDQATGLGKDPLRWMVLFTILLFIFGFSYFLLEEWDEALWFTGYVLFAFGALWLLALGTMKAIRRFLPISLNYPARQALANLYRPNNQTVSLLATIGLGTAMIGTLFFIQNQLLDEVRFADKGDQPNMLFFDIQTHQVDSMKAVLGDNGLPILQHVPIVTMGVSEVNGQTRDDNEQLPDEERRSNSMYNREFRVTYRDTLIRTEELIAGKLIPYSSEADSIFISMEEGYANRNKVELGDEVVFNVQGRPLTTYVGSFRKVNFRQVSTNFLVVFPDKVLENAPKFHVLITKTKNDQQSADIQNLMVRQFPNVSVVNLSMIVETLEDILSKISFVIQFMALFSILTGILVLISSLLISKFQRIRENILLRTIGAERPVLLKINALEYFFLGSLAAGGGLVLSVVAAFLLSYYVFEISFRMEWLPLMLVFGVITLLTVFLGWINSLSILKAKTMDILRT
ncbi:putative ABC transport system permease protein [Cyclobacterium lianum]|uniref:Putative ABC transport system permease protein n=1 Tax=Cyclobacterium lianum TaxID=388280 RepID=A0A1M7PIU9_9BACT|nr:FtsX-like permease family protein [Cyclobacterium lianum]SHN17035.1 putative ABC transport system permease protein [Cyclobacterium lianum]